MALNRTNLKQTPIPVVSRTMQIVNTDGTVTRSGQLLLQQLQASEALQGTHGGRPDPSAAPDGAIYVESDRTVLYSSINGAWHYIAGTMWGTINPDQRPTDLGVNDAGFDFRTVDDPAREFIWSQAYWVEVTPARYGTHAQRLAVSIPNVIDQMIWSETDRGEVTYQLQSHVWKYLAGTMSGTISPDQRPTDLGVNDTGFGYRATDQQRQFYWNGTAWVETTAPPSVSTQNVVTGSRSYGVVYRNTGATPRYVSVSPQFAAGAAGVLQQVQALTDAANPPVTVVASAYIEISVSTFAIYAGAPLFFVVLPGNYYQAVASGSPAIYQWIEWQ